MAKPFIKWAGGKTYLLPKLKSVLADFDTKSYAYAEPMVGGGAVMYGLGKSFHSITINDINPELINLYRVIQTKVEMLIAELSSGNYTYEHKSVPATKSNYYNIRNSQPADSVKQAARIMYLLKTCFNGLMRTNKKGGFNVPMGSYLNPTVCDSNGLRDCATFLTRVNIEDPGDAIEFVREHGGPQTFMFVDPPYHSPGAGNGGKFKSYSGNEFGPTEQAGLVDALLKSGSPFIYTNRATPFITGLFAGSGITIEEVNLKHSIQPKYTTGLVESELIASQLW